jgi:proliferating cell nuclear antigen PCNA
MEIIITNVIKTASFVELFQHLKLFTNIVSITLSNERFYIQGMDSSQLSVFEISLLRDWFNTYNIEKDVVISVNVNIFAKILHIHKCPQSITLNVQEDNLEIKFESEGKEFNKEFLMPLMEYECQHLTIPDKEYDMDIVLDSKKFKNVIDQLSNFGDSLTIKYQEDQGVLLTSTSDTEGSMKIIMKIDEVDECSINENQDTECTFRIKYIQFMSQYYKISKSVELNFTNDNPMQCKYTFDENKDNYIRFYLVPVIDD